MTKRVSPAAGAKKTISAISGVALVGLVTSFQMATAQELTVPEIQSTSSDKVAATSKQVNVNTTAPGQSTQSSEPVVTEPSAKAPTEQSAAPVAVPVVEQPAAPAPVVEQPTPVAAPVAPAPAPAAPVAPVAPVAPAPVAPAPVNGTTGGSG